MCSSDLVGGGAGAEFAVATDRSGALPLLVRNGGVANHVVIEAGAWSVSLDLSAGEIRTIAVPVDHRQVATALRVVPSSGFRPKDVDPTAADDRYLGVWIEPAG